MSGRRRPKRIPLIVRPPLPPPPPRASLISAYHSLIRQRDSLPADDPSLPSLDDAIDDLGGLPSYQAASVQGHSSSHRFNTSHWVISHLSHHPRFSSQLAPLQHRRRRRRSPDTPPPALPSTLSTHPRPRVLDIGAITNHYLPYTAWLDVLPIDLHPLHPSVVQMDFFDMSEVEYGGVFDVVVASLVLNFVEGVGKRGRMVRRMARMLKMGGVGYVVLPAACVGHSRWVDEEVVREVMEKCGLEVKGVRWSAKLVMVEVEKVREEQSREGYKPRKVRMGAEFNNFSIELPPLEEDEEHRAKGGGEDVVDAADSEVSSTVQGEAQKQASNTRKRKRHRK